MDEDDDEVKRMGCSSEHGWWWRGGVMTMGNDGGVISMREGRRARKSSKVRGWDAVCSGGALSLLYRSRRQ
jgi:hypothetical protein